MVGWRPADFLHFDLSYVDASGCIDYGQSQLIPVAKGIVSPDDYLPGGLGLQAWGHELTLTPSQQSAAPPPTLYISVEPINAPKASVGGKLRELCCGCRRFGDLAHLPQSLMSAFWEVLGAPSALRQERQMMPLILVPGGLFVFLTWFSWLAFHFFPNVQYFLYGLFGLLSVASIAASVTVKWPKEQQANGQSRQQPFFAMGFLCLLAVVLAFLMGMGGWQGFWEQWWWMHTGRIAGATAGTPADARSDAAVINFQTVKNGTLWTSVDAGRAAGFRRGDIYCAAPILDPTIALGAIIRVEFWAIGINCCDDFGSFTCDASREQGLRGGGVGVVMKNPGDHIGAGMPGIGENAELFRMATEKAAGAFSMVSAPGALMVRWVTMP